MMKKIVYLFIFTMCSLLASAQSNYDAALIPKELLPYASAIIRDEDLSIDVQDLNNVIVHKRMVVTVLNKNGDDMSKIEIEHDKSTIIKSVKGFVYNEFGKQTGKFSESNFDDASAWDGFSLFTDARVKHYSPSVTEYPYTIAYAYELHLKQSLAVPQWIPVDNFGVAVQKSSFEYVCKPDFKIRYRETGPAVPAIISTNPKGLTTYSWIKNNAKAIKYELLSPYSKNYLTSVEIVPESFSYYNINGSFADWKGIGKWMYDKILVGRQDLPSETVQYIKQITQDINDPKLKAKKIYEYMQSKTHYVNVAVGIGGNQPLFASEVDKLNYGDCKALVNYTQALLKAVNIESYYCEVEAGRDYKISMASDFASMEQANHIILCLPFKNDTTWCDCTNQTIPFGYLGRFTDDRLVLACTPDGGKLMHTPKYTWKANLESRKAEFVINENAELSGEMKTTFKGADYEDREYLMHDSRVEQIKMLQHQYPINNMEIESLNYSQDKSLNPVTTEKVKLHARDFASVSDGKYYFLLNPVNRIAEPPRVVRNRLNPVYINRGYTDEDEIIYTIPAGYHLEKVPLDIAIDKPYGKFKAKMLLKGNQLIYKRTLELIDGTYSKDTYPDLVDFYQEIVDADSYNVVLVK